MSCTCRISAAEAATAAAAQAAPGSHGVAGMATSLANIGNESTCEPTVMQDTSLNASLDVTLVEDEDNPDTSMDSMELNLDIDGEPLAV